MRASSDFKKWSLNSTNSLKNELRTPPIHIKWTEITLVGKIEKWKYMVKSLVFSVNIQRYKSLQIIILTLIHSHSKQSNFALIHMKRYFYLHNINNSNNFHREFPFFLSSCCEIDLFKPIIDGNNTFGHFPLSPGSNTHENKRHQIQTNKITIIFFSGELNWKEMPST